MDKTMHALFKVVQVLTFVLLSMLLVSCSGDKTEQESNDTENKSPLQLDVSQRDVIPAVTQTTVSGKTIGISEIIETGRLNSSGQFEYPQANSEFNGNITVSVQATDVDGISRVFIAFSGADFQLNICEQNCGTEFAAFVNGINPLQFGLSSGEQIIEIWVEDNESNLDKVDSIAINWSALVVSGVTASIDADSEEISVSWSEVAGMLRYNLYLATDPSLNGKNVEELEGGDARLALTETSGSFTEKAFEQNYYLLVTGVDGSGESAFSEVVSLLNGINTTSPNANDDTAAVAEDAQLQLNVLDNDVANAESISVVQQLIQEPQNGEAEITADGLLIYTPADNFFGLDTLVYQVVNSDNLTAQATVTIDVTPVNDAPLAVEDLFIYDPASDSLVVEVPGVLANDSDIEADALTLSSELVTSPEFGSISLAADGGFTFTPNERFVNYDEFSYQVLDTSGASDTGLVKIQTADFNGYPPVTVSDAYQVNEDGFLQVTQDDGILNNDFDEDDDLSSLTLSIIENVANGELILEANGAFDYTPNNNFNGTDSFVYQLTDSNNNFTKATVTISVQAQNDAPQTVSDSYLVAIGQTLSVTAEAGVLSNDVDFEADDITVVLDSIGEPSSGTLAMSEDGAFTYTPNQSFSGTDSFTYVASDGQLTSAITTVQVRVADIQYTTNDVNSIAVLMASDLPEGVALADVIFVVENGVVEISEGIAYFIPNADYNGLVLVEYTYVNNGSQEQEQFYIEVVSSALAFSSQTSLELAENVAAGTILYTAQASDALGQTITYSLDTSSASQLSSVKAKAAVDSSQLFEIDSVTGALYLKQGEALDFESESQLVVNVIAESTSAVQATLTLQIDVTNVNEAPAPQDDTVSVEKYSSVNIDVLINDTDPESDALSIVASSLTSNSGQVQLESDQSISYIPNDDASIDVITYTVEDTDGLTASATLTVTVLDAFAEGDHDANADGTNDVSIIKSDDLQEWHLTFNTNATLVSGVDNNRLYPLEPNQSGEFTTQIPFAHLSSSFELVIDEHSYQLDLTALDDDGYINLERTGVSLPLDFSSLTLPATFTYIEVAYNTENNEKYNTATINAGYSSGATLQFNADNSGVYTDDEGRETFTWSITESVITVAKDTPVSETESISLSELLALGVIDQATFENYIELYGSEYDLISVTVTEPTIKISITENLNAFYTFDEETTVSYQLPSELGGASSEISTETQSVRAYQTELLSLQAFTPLDSNGQWVLPISDPGGQYQSDVKAVAAYFSDNSSGQFVDFETGISETFTWSMNGLTLQISADDVEYSYQFFGRYSDAWYVLMEAYNSVDDEFYAAVDYATPKLSQELTPITDLMTGGILTNLFTTTNPDSYDADGNLVADNFFAQELTMVAEPNAGSGMYKSYRYVYNEGEAYISQLAWYQDTNHFYINNYINYGDGTAGLCDPDLDSGCTLYQQRDIEVLSYDSDNALVWVVESSKTLQYPTIPFDPNSVEFATSIKPRVTAYSLYPSQTLASDTLSINEDSASSTVDVLANDLISTGLTDGLTLIGVSAESGSVSIVNGEIVYTPVFNFSGTDTITYLVMGPDGQITSEQVTVTVIAVNDQPQSDNINQTALEGGSITIDLLALASDPDGDTLTVAAGSIPSSTAISSIIDNNDGTVTYTHNGDETFSDVFTYQVTDGELNSDVINVNITVTPVNDAPIFSSSASLALNENESTSAVVYGASATDAEGDGVTFTLSDPNSIFTMASNGDMVISDNSQLDYETLTSYDLTVIADDGTDTTSHTVTISLNDIVENTELVVDSTFGNNGYTQFNPYTDVDNDEYLIDAKLDRFNNRYVLIRVTGVELNEFVVAKYTDNNELDESFGINGIKRVYAANQNDPNVDVLSNYPDELTPAKLIVHDSALSPHDGKVYVVGTESVDGAGYIPFVIRLNADGFLDDTFSSDGQYQNNSLTDGSATDLLIHSNGDLYLFGDVGTSAQLFVQTLDTDGNELTNYGTYDFSGGYNNIARSLLENSNDELVAIGYVDNSYDTDIVVARLSSVAEDVANNVVNDWTLLDVMDISISDGPSSDIVNGAVKYDDSTALIFGSTNFLSSSNQDAFILKMNIDDLTLFGDGDSECTVNGNCFGSEDANDDGLPDGISIIDVSAAYNDEATSVAINNNNDITFMTSLYDGNKYYLQAYQVDSLGIQTTASAALAATELTEVHESNDPGTLDDSAFGVVLHDVNDTDNNLHVITSKQVQNSTFTELQTWITQFNSSGSSDLDGDSYEYDVFKINDHTESKVNAFSTFMDTDNGNLYVQSLTNESFEQTFDLALYNYGYFGVRSTFSTNEKTYSLKADTYNTLSYPSADAVILPDQSLVSAVVKDDYGTLSIFIQRLTANGGNYTGAELPTGSMTISKCTSSDLVINKVLHDADNSLLYIIGKDDGIGPNAETLLIGIDTSATPWAEIFHVTVDILNRNGPSEGFDVALLPDGGFAVAGGVLNDDSLYHGYVTKFVIDEDGDANDNITGISANLLGDLEIDPVFDSDGDDDGAITVELTGGSSDNYATKIEVGRDSILIVLVNTLDPDLGYVLKMKPSSSLAFAWDTTFNNEYESTFSESLPIGNWSPNFKVVSQSQSNRLAHIKDIHVKDDELWLSGSVDFNVITLPFVGKFDAWTGNADETFGQSTLPGVFVPYARNSCENESKQFTSLCSVTSYNNIDVASDGAIIVSGTVSSWAGNSDGFFIKFLEQQDDSAINYVIVDQAPP